jgi:hypothetical protein
MSEMVRLIRYAELLSNRRFMTKQDLIPDGHPNSP